MLDRECFRERQRLADAAVVDYQGRVSDLELQLADRITPQDRIERRQILVKLGEERRILRWLEWRQAEITQALWALDKQDKEVI